MDLSSGRSIFVCARLPTLKVALALARAPCFAHPTGLDRPTRQRYRLTLEFLKEFETAFSSFIEFLANRECLSEAEISISINNVGPQCSPIWCNVVNAGGKCV